MIFCRNEMAPSHKIIVVPFVDFLIFEFACANEIFLFGGGESYNINVGRFVFFRAFLFNHFSPPPRADFVNKGAKFAKNSFLEGEISAHILKDGAHVFVKLFLHDFIVIEFSLTHFDDAYGAWNKLIPEFEHGVF